MGLLRFFVDPVDAPPDWRQGQRAFISAFDGRVHPTKVEFDGRMLNCRRQQRESGKLHVPWNIRGRGCPVVSTTSLPEREQPYVLQLELARGKLAEVREQAAVWQMLRMSIPDEFQRIQSAAFQLLARASASQTDLSQTCRLAQECLEKAFDAADMLTHAYVVQRQASNRASGVHRPGLLGCRVDEALLASPEQDEFSRVFTSAVIPLEWRSVEPKEGHYNWETLDQLVNYSAEHRLIMRAGPLIDLSPNGLPNWLRTWENDILNLPSFVCDFVETAIGRYTGPIRMWEVASYGNTGGALPLSEDHRLALVARILETAVRTHSDGLFFLRVDQPWGEYQSRGEHRLSPFQFVDALLRSNLGLTGVNLEIAMGYQQAGSLARDLLSISRLIDTWGQLGAQLHVTVACPSSASIDPAARAAVEIETSATENGWSEAAQANWLRETVSLLLAKPAVTGVYVSHLNDSAAHRYPNAGLIDAQGRRKESWNAVTQAHHQAIAGG